MSNATVSATERRTPMTEDERAEAAFNNAHFRITDGE